MAAPIDALPAPTSKPQRGYRRWFFVGLLWLIGLALLAASLIGYWPRAPWWVRMVTPFRFQYLLGGLVLAIIGARRHGAWGTRSLATLCVLLNLAVLWPWLLPVGDTAPAVAIRVMTWNTWTRHPDPSQVIRAVEKSNADLALLCETPQPWRTGDAPEIAGYNCFADDQYLIAVKRDGPVKVIEQGVNQPHGALEAIVEWGQRQARIVCLHAARPTSELGVRLQGYRYKGLLNRFQGEHPPTVVVGDFNQTPWCPGLSDVLRETHLRDAARGRGVWGTYPASPLALRWLAAIPIDHCFYSSELRSGSCRVGPANGSNHRPLVVSLGWRSAN